MCLFVFVPWNWINMKCLIYAVHCFNYGNCQTNWLLIFKFSSTVIVSWISFTPTELQTFTHTLYYFQHKFTRNLAQESSHWGYSDYVVCLAKYQGIYIKISIENFLGPRPGVNFMRLSFCKRVTTALHMCQWKLQRIFSCDDPLMCMQILWLVLIPKNCYSNAFVVVGKSECTPCYTQKRGIWFAVVTTTIHWYTLYGYPYLFHAIEKPLYIHQYFTQPFHHTPRLYVFSMIWHVVMVMQTFL